MDVCNEAKENPKEAATASPCPGIVDGGFTCAFLEFGRDESGGTGRLILSIAGW